MHKFSIAQDNHIKSILCLGAHCDDIEIGCGGTLLNIGLSRPDISIHFVVFSSNDIRKQEALNSAEDFLQPILKKNIFIENFKNGFFPYQGSAIKDYFEVLKSKINPDLIFTHYRQDLHQDHKLISELTWNTFRNNFILEYEIAKYDGDIGSPTVFCQLPKALCLKKVEYIFKHYNSQKDKQWFTEDTFLSLLRIRGIESNSDSGYSEAFYCKKILLL